MSMLLILLRTHCQAGCCLQVCLHEEEVPSALLNMHEPSQLPVVELKCWLKCTAATTVGKKQNLVKW